MRRLAVWLCIALVFTIPWENIVELPGIGRISRAMGLLVAAAWVATIAASGRIRRPGPFQVLVLLFVLWNGASLLWTVDPHATLDRVLTYAQVFALTYIVWDTLTTLESLELALEAYVLGAWVTAISLMWSFLAHGPAAYQVRFTTGTFQVDDVSLILSLGIPSAWYLAVHARGLRLVRALRWVNFAYVPLGLVGIMLTASRTALVSSAAGLAYIAASLPRLSWRARTLSLVLIAGLFLGLASFVPPATVARLGTLRASTDTTEGELNGRGPVWREAYATFQDHPLIGVGSGAFRAVNTMKVTHNFVLGFLVEIGMIGFALFVAILGLAAWNAGRQPSGRLGLWTSVLATWLIGASLYNFQEKKQTWLFLALVVAGGSLVGQVVKGRAARARRPRAALARAGGMVRGA